MESDIGVSSSSSSSKQDDNKTSIESTPVQSEQACMATATATTFPIFRKLPYELRARVWELTAEPRCVEIDFFHRVTSIDRPPRPPLPPWVFDFKRFEDPKEPKKLKSQQLRSSTPVPAPIQTCQEARNLGLYKKTFSELEILPEGGESRYVWLNLDIDMIDVGDQSFPGKFWPARASIQRLKLRYETWDWGFEQVAGRASLGTCKNLKEVHISCVDGFFAWAIRRCWSEYYDWPPCGKENMRFSEPGDDDRLITGAELEEGNWVEEDTGRTMEEARLLQKGLFSIRRLADGSLLVACNE